MLTFYLKPLLEISILNKAVHCISFVASHINYKYGLKLEAGGVKWTQQKYFRIVRDTIIFTQMVESCQRYLVSMDSVKLFPLRLYEHPRLRT